MKILLCSPIPSLDARLGAARVAVDFASGLDELGIDYDLYPRPDQTIPRVEYAAHLQAFLPTVARQYDVIDYPFHAKPWIDNAADAAGTLKVARIMLLPHHEDFEADPQPPQTLYRRLRNTARVICGRKKPPLYSPEIRRDMDDNIRRAHLTNVGNTADRECLIRLGFDADKIKVFPYGLTSAGAAAFDQLNASNSKPTRSPIVAFIGTFDYRKGCLDFPQIVNQITAAVPDVRFRLLGTKGMMQTSAQVRSFFPHKLRARIEIQPTFNPAELPQLLADCSIGIFPSYREGFGIAVVEMLAAGLPVFAYDVAGPCDILPPQWLVERGSAKELSRRAIDALQAPAPLRQDLSTQAIATSRQFHWRKIAANTIDCYQQCLANLRAGLPATQDGA